MKSHQIAKLSAMKIVCAPDSFKSSLSAIEVCQALQNGARRVFPAAQIELCPLADGGEGTLDCLIQSANGFLKTTRVRDPLGQSIEAKWGILPDGKAVIEMARASGLTLISPEKRDAKRASTFGTGQLIQAALRARCREILIGIGGSATTDGGSGALTALGAHFRDDKNVVLSPGGAALVHLKTLDLRFFEPKLQRAQITLLCDVSNPLCGENGAARIYGPQKGAAPHDVEILDAALSNFARVARQQTGADFSNHSGAGAAGGLAFGLMAFCGAKVRSGIEVVLEAANFEEKLRGAALVLTGEGALDAQTLHGKVVAGVCRAANAQQIPVIAFGGKVDLSGAQMDELGLKSAFSILDGPRDLDFCVQNAAQLLANATERVLRLWK